MPLPLPTASISVAQFLPRHVFHAILDDYVNRVYPVLPLVHVPTFRSLLATGAFDTDPGFLRLCIALCAVTIASIPKDMARHGLTWYADAGDLVEKAAKLVTLSRIASHPDWQNKATVESMIVSIVLSLASHYAGKANAGWAYAGEAVLFFRELELFKRAAYDGLTPIEKELCKRAFWILFIVQIHDRMSFIIPHTGLSHDPQHTDWEFLLPMNVSDEELTAGQPQPNGAVPLISGFIALVKVFLCIVDLLDKSFPGPPSYFGLSPGAVAARLLPVHTLNKDKLHSHPDMPHLDSLFHMMTRLDATLGDLPEPLRLPQRDEQIPVSLPIENQSQVDTQFGIMRANIHITGIYLQSMILEMCLNELQSRSRSISFLSSYENTINAQLWTMKESVARELLDILSLSSTPVLESNGLSMIKKIREIAATFLEQQSSPESPDGLGDIERRSKEYLGRFVQILTDLDYNPTTPS